MVMPIVVSFALIGVLLMGAVAMWRLKAKLFAWMYLVGAALVTAIMLTGFSTFG